MAFYEKWKSEGYNIGCKGCKEWEARCPNCHELVESADPISSNYRFCPYCGFDMKSDFQRVADRRQFTDCLQELRAYRKLEICGNCRHYVKGTRHFGECHATSDIEPCIVSIVQPACDTLFDYKDFRNGFENPKP